MTRRIERCLSWCIDDGGVCRFCGWPKEDVMADGVRIYDVATDQYRDVTQADIDLLNALAASRARIISAVEQEDARCREEMRVIRSRVAA